MAERVYIHGYSDVEQQRLLQQSEYWREMLILPGLDYKPGEKLLEIACAAGGTLGVIGREFPGLHLAGIDVQPRQIDFARRYLESLGYPDADLRVGNAEHLPWGEGEFDHVYIMWFLEHLHDPSAVLREARRVLKPGGDIIAIEADYTSFRAYPMNEDYEYLREAQYNIFRRNGNPDIGPQLGALLVQHGFSNVRSQPAGFHFFRCPGDDALRRNMEYIAGFVEGYLELMAEQLDLDLERLRRGFHYMRELPDLPNGSYTQIIYKARGYRN